jgi:hypothetical protein
MVLKSAAIAGSNFEVWVGDIFASKPGHSGRLGQLRGQLGPASSGQLAKLGPSSGQARAKLGPLASKVSKGAAILAQV